MRRKLGSCRRQALVLVLAVVAGVGLSAFPDATAVVPNGWSAATSVDPPHGGPTSISCASSTFCAEVDDHGDAFTYDGVTWSAPVRIDETTFDFPIKLNAVSCASSSFCAAVDQLGSAVSYNGTTWSVPHTIDSDKSLTSVSCPTSTFCAAVDREGYVITYNGSTWSLPTLVDAGDAGAAREVPCTSSTFCAIVSPGAAVTYNGSSWSSITSIDIGPSVYGLSCASPTFCVAQGDNGFSPGATIYNGSTWSSPSGNGGGNGVSCPTSTFCVAVNRGMYSTYTSGTWSTPTALALNLVSVSCPSSSYCAATGVDNAVGVGDHEVTDAGAVFSYQSGTWSAPAAVDPLGGGAGSVSCATSVSCVAVAGGMDASIYDGIQWTFNSYIDIDNVALAAVSCPSSTFCMAVNSAGDALTFNGSSWSAPTAVDANRGLTAVSCSSTTACIAVDSTGNYLSYNGSGWTLPATIDVDTGLASVSCPTSTFCAALDQLGHALTFQGAVWSSPAVALGSSGPNAVSCTSATFCIAVGGGKASTYRGSTWSAPASIAQRFNAMADVSCVSATFCTGVGTDGYAYTFDGSAWTTTQHFAVDATVDSISCVSASFCVAMDLLGNAYTYGGPLALPIRTAGPTVSGIPRVGHTLACHVTYTGANAVSYGWTRNGKVVNKAAKATYPLKARDLHTKIICLTRARNAGGRTPVAASRAVTIKRGSPLTSRAAPTVVGVAKVGKTVRAKAGSWSPSATSFTYHWLAGGHPIRHATRKSFTIPAGYKGKRLSVKVTAHRPGYANGSAISKNVRVR
jgi:hypothetical protein